MVPNSGMSSRSCCGSAAEVDCREGVLSVPGVGVFGGVGVDFDANFASKVGYGMFGIWILSGLVEKLYSRWDGRVET